MPCSLPPAGAQSVPRGGPSGLTHEDLLAQGRDRGEAAADRHPGADLDDAADLPPVPVRDLAQGVRARRQAVAGPSDAAELPHRVQGAAPLPRALLAADVELADHRGRGRRADAVRRHLRRVRDQPPQGARRAHGDEPRAVHVFHPGGVPRGADVQDDGRLRPAEQPVGADPRHDDDRGAVLDLGAEAGVRQAAATSSTRRRRWTARRRCSSSGSCTCR